MTALAVSPDGSRVASADLGARGRPAVHLWTSAGGVKAGVKALGRVLSGLWTAGCPPFALDYSPENPELLTTIGLIYLRLNDNQVQTRPRSRNRTSSCIAPSSIALLPPPFLPDQPGSAPCPSLARPVSRVECAREKDG